MPDLHGVRLGGMRSGEVIVTDEELGRGGDPFTKLARALLAEIFELKAQMEEQRFIPPDQYLKDRKGQQREIDRWKKANEELKRAAQDLTQQVSELEIEVERLTTENVDLKERLTEAVFRTESLRVRHKLPKDEPGQYPLTEHMTERAYNEWMKLQKLMKEIPYQGTKENNDDA